MVSEWVTNLADRESSPGPSARHGSATLAGEVGACRKLGRVLDSVAMGTMVRIRLNVPGWGEARPGQFALLQAEPSGQFLGRALSVSDQSDETVAFLVAPVGPGTRELCALEKDRGVWVQGPLGNGFDLKALTAGVGRVLLVGGGAGVAPFPLLVKELERLSRAEWSVGRGTTEPAVLVLAGFRDSDQSLACTPLTDVVAGAKDDGLACVYEQVLEDPVRTPSERVTDLLARHLRSGDRLAVCGPEAMAEAVWGVCRTVADVKVWFSLETNMACGVGSCHGCVVSLADGSYARVCREGPVFSGEQVFGD